MSLIDSAMLRVFAILCALLAIAGPSAADSHDHNMAFGSLDVMAINGQPVPGKILPLQDVSTLLDTITTTGQHLRVTRGTRKAGTRMAIHVHEHDGFTCVLQGEITIFIEGREPAKYAAGTCYHMPANIFMAAANLGHEDAILTDNFIVPPGVPLTVVREAGYPAE